MPSPNQVTAQSDFNEAVGLLRIGKASEAVRIARRGARHVGDQFTRNINLAGILIDAGSDLSKTALIREGVDALVDVESIVPEKYKAQYHYNLGTGYSALGQRQRGAGPGTKPSLSRAVSQFDESVRINPSLKSRTNLGIALMQQGRWGEALDEFEFVVQDSPDHHVALAHRAACLVKIEDLTSGHLCLLQAARSDYERAIENAHDEPVFAANYGRSIRRLPTRKRCHSTVASLPRRDQAWIWENGLALNPCPICRAESPDAFDVYPLAGLLKGRRRGLSDAELQDSLNSICRSYSTARWELYIGASGIEIEETGHVIVMPSGTDADYSLQQGLLFSSVSGFYGVLNQIAFLLNEYLQLGHKWNAVNFDSVWSPAKTRGPIPNIRAGLHPKLQRLSSPGLSALFRLAHSLQHGKGRYYELRKLRNNTQHHIFISTKADFQSDHYACVSSRDLAAQANQIGRISRAAIWYLGATILRRETDRRNRATRGKRVVVPESGLPIKRL